MSLKKDGTCYISELRKQALLTPRDRTDQKTFVMRTDSASTRTLCKLISKITPRANIFNAMGVSS